MIRKSMTSGYEPAGATSRRACSGFPSRRARNAFARRSCPT